MPITGTPTENISALIVAAAEGADEGIAILKSNDINVELEEFEIEVTYAAETEIEDKTQGKVELKFKVLKAKIGHTRSTRQKATYGMKVRFLFAGKEKEGP